MQQKKLTISEVAELLEIAPKTIRHYHEVGVLPEPERGENGYRLYTAAALRQIHRIRELQSFGLTLRRIKFVLESDDPDIHLRAFLLRRDDELAQDIWRLQRQQSRVRDALSNANIQDKMQTSSAQILRDKIKPVSNHLADLVFEVEKHPLADIDLLPHQENWIDYWEHVGTLITNSIQLYGSSIGLWFERYLALADFAHDDRQGLVWLQELRSTMSNSILQSALNLPHSGLLPEQQQMQIRRLLPLLLYEQASPLQKEFLEALKQVPRR